MKRFLSISIAMLAIFMAGCATTISSQVTTFHEWQNGVQNQTYAIERTGAQEDGPEYQHYTQMLRDKLNKLGLIESANHTTSSLKITMAYQTLVSDMQLSMPFNTMTYDPFWGMHYSRAYPRSAFFYPGYIRRPSDLLWMQDYSIRRYFMHQLEVIIIDRKSEKKLFDVRASTEQVNSEISLYLPYLIESAFQNFPGKSGSTINLNLPISQ